MPFPDSNSFAPLFTITLPRPFALHPDACNPVMDLVILLGSTDSASSAGAQKGKTKATVNSTLQCIEDSWEVISLWRMSGSNVWQVKLTSGSVVGLAWSLDGLFLSLLISDQWPISTSSSSSFPESGNVGLHVEHRSVHTGEIVSSVPLDINWSSLTPQERQALTERKWKLRWEDTGAVWQGFKPGSSLMVIDSLPRVTPVDPPKPAIMNPFMMVAKNKIEKPKPHPLLTSFPVLLSAEPLIEPHILCINLTRPTHLLTGTFQIPTFSSSSISTSPLTFASMSSSSTTVGGHKRPHPAYLHLARLSDTLAHLLNVVAQGLEAAGLAIKEGEKQTMIWREEVESCAEQQGMSKSDVHADLLRLLLTGRCGAAVNEWLGNRMSNRVVAKWESSLVNSFKTVSKLIAESISPALERIILILEELLNWSQRGLAPTPLSLETNDVVLTLRYAKGLLSLVEEMREEAILELETSIEWFRWLKFEIARGAMISDSNSEQVTLAIYDLKHAWAFLQNGFIFSTFSRHFPSILGSNTEYVPDNVIENPITNSLSPPRSLDVVLRDSIERLSSPQGAGGNGSVNQFSTPNLPQDLSTNSSNIMSIVPDSPSQVFSAGNDDDDNDDDEGIPDSPDTVERKMEVEEEMDTRERELEPKLWLNSLIKACTRMVRGANKGQGKEELVHASPGEAYWHQLAGEGAIRVVEKDTWLACISDSSLLLACRSIGSNTVSTGFFALHEDAVFCAASQFFDDVELALVLRSKEEQDGIYLVTVEYRTLRYALVPIGIDELPSFNARPTITLPISRSRKLENINQGGNTDNGQGIKGTKMVSIALNGRKGRRVGCVLSEDGTGVEVFDMDEDEDGQEEGDDEGEGGADDAMRESGEQEDVELGVDL